MHPTRATQSYRKGQQNPATPDMRCRQASPHSFRTPRTSTATGSPSSPYSSRGRNDPTDRPGDPACRPDAGDGLRRPRTVAEWVTQLEDHLGWQAICTFLEETHGDVLGDLGVASPDAADRRSVSMMCRSGLYGAPRETSKMPHFHRSCAAVCSLCVYGQLGRAVLDCRFGRRNPAARSPSRRNKFGWLSKPL